MFFFFEEITVNVLPKVEEKFSCLAALPTNNATICLKKNLIHLPTPSRNKSYSFQQFIKISLT